MGLVVNTNVTSLLAQKSLRQNTRLYENSLQKVSTGKRINAASDDAAGHAITKILENQIAGIKRGSENAQDGTNLLVITESAFNTITDNIQRIRELTIQAANSSNSSSERWAITQEVRERLRDITNVAESTIFNGVSLLGISAPTVTGGFKFTIGPDANDTVDVAGALGNARATALHSALVSTIDFTLMISQTSYSAYIEDLDQALKEIVTRRSRLGAVQNQLEAAVNNLEIRDINVTSAKSRLKDVNIASESAEMVKQQILRNASVSVLVQANNVPKLVLGLLQGS